MAKTILIELKAEDKASAKIKKVEKSVTSLGRKASTSMKPAVKSTQDVQVALNRMGNKFRFMTIAFGALAIGAISLVKGFIDSAREMEAATLRVGVFAVSTGQSMDKAQASALNLAKTGLVSVTEASNSLSNLLATGLNIDTAEVLLRKMLDTAVLSKESLTDTFGRALEKSTLGIRILQERQVDAIGINFRADQVWRAYGKTLGKTTAEMSTQEKQMAIVNFLLKETERFAGGAELAMQTFGGTMSRLNTTVEIMKAKIGATLIPLVGSLTDVLSGASTKLTEMAESNAVLVSIMVSGVTVMVTLVAALAALGAIVPLVTSGFTGLKGGLGLLGKAALLTSIKFIALAAIIGGIIFLVLKLTGRWDKWSNSMKNLAQRIKDTINPFKQQGDAASDASEKIKKQIEKLEKQMFLTTRTFKENIAEWAKKNKEAVEDITKDITGLQRDYKDAVNRINEDFNRSFEDASISHARKTEDIKRQLDEEVSKGIWADQQKIRSLKLRLKRENEDFSRQGKKLNTDKDKDLKEETSRFDERLTKLKSELDEELALQKKHQEEIAKVVDVRILDEVEKMRRAFDERIVDLKEQLAETKKSTEGQTKSATDMVNTMLMGNDALKTSNERVADSVKNTTGEYQNLRRLIQEVPREATSFGQKAGRAISDIVKFEIASVTDMITHYRNEFRSLKRDITDPNFNNWITKLAEATRFDDLFRRTSQNVTGFARGLFGFEDGGVVPGNPSQAVPIIAHGGETIIPANQSPVTVNINNPTVRDESDIRRIADSVEEVLSRRQFLRHFK
ncbi:MAG: hypothetical protein KJI69_05980 [Patescibacteria group bacterium]|nr:hypothetical protein [Patescibacteria group bacterium]